MTGFDGAALASEAMVETPSATRPPPAPRRAAAPRRKLFRHPGRVAVVVIALLVVLNLSIVLLDNADTSPGGVNPLPATVESVSPVPGSIAGPIDTITVDLDNSLTGVLLIKIRGSYVEIPEDQLDRVVELGQLSYRPGPGKEITTFPQGENDVLVYYWSKTAPGRAAEAPGELRMELPGQGVSVSEPGIPASSERPVSEGVTVSARGARRRPGPRHA